MEIQLPDSGQNTWHFLGSIKLKRYFLLSCLSQFQSSTLILVGLFLVNPIFNWERSPHFPHFPFSQTLCCGFCWPGVTPKMLLRLLWWEMSKAKETQDAFFALETGKCAHIFSRMESDPLNRTEIYLNMSVISCSTILSTDQYQDIKCEYNPATNRLKQ